MSTLVRSIEIDAPTGEVWRVLTTRDLVREWADAFADEVDIQTSWKPGAAVLWKAPGGYLRQGVVGEFVPERRLAFRYPDADPPQAEQFELAVEGARTRLTLTLTNPAGDAARLAAHLLAAIRSLSEEAAEISARRPREDKRSG